jgi:hypothetical protein
MPVRLVLLNSQAVSSLLAKITRLQSIPSGLFSSTELYICYGIPIGEVVVVSSGDFANRLTAMCSNSVSSDSGDFERVNVRLDFNLKPYLLDGSL